jgi:signal transduction histidine kinase
VNPATIEKRATADVLDRLLAHRTLGGAPRQELEWLATHGELRRYPANSLLVEKGSPVTAMYILFSGHGAIFVDRGGGSRKFMEWAAGDVTGLLPFSRAHTAIGRAVFDQPTEALAVHRDEFPELIRECPTVTATLVHTMLDRSRHFAATDWQDEKLLALGRLAAGLAHELNNPASAATRSATVLAEALTHVEDAAYALGAAQLTEQQRSAIAQLRERSFIPATTGIFSAIERTDREDDLTAWLEAHGADVVPAVALAESGVTPDVLDELADVFKGGALDAALRWIAAGYTARSLADDVKRASARIYDLVSSVKRFTYMDRATVAEPANITQGLADTVAVLAAKAKAKSIAVTLDAPADLPLVRMYPAELNQVWSNLVENALDAVDPSGHVEIRAVPQGAAVVVRVIDDGPGIPSEILGRIFDPFFTTKAMGQGTGLGLDITRRIVRVHDGQIEVESRPGRTEFRVTLPVVSSPA